MKKLLIILGAFLALFTWQIDTAFAIRDITAQYTGTVIEAPIPPQVLERYEGLETGFTVEGFPTLGDTDAMILLEDFSSFSCSHCRNFYTMTFVELIEDYISTENVFFVYVPIYTTGHVPNSWQANRAALCVAEQGYFWQYAETLFDWHTVYDVDAFFDARLRQGVINLELDVTEWDDCMASTRPDGVLETALQLMFDRNVTGTPGVLINQEPVNANPLSIREALEDLIGDRL